VFLKSYTVHILGAKQLFMADWGVWCGRPGRRSIRGGNMGINIYILNEKKSAFRAQQFKIIHKIKMKFNT
jgi:hypothetical protein